MSLDKSFSNIQNLNLENKLYLIALRSCKDLGQLWNE